MNKARLHINEEKVLSHCVKSLRAGDKRRERGQRQEILGARDLLTHGRYGLDKCYSHVGGKVGVGDLGRSSSHQQP